LELTLRYFGTRACSNEELSKAQCRPDLEFGSDSRNPLTPASFFGIIDAGYWNAKPETPR